MLKTPKKVTDEAMQTRGRREDKAVNSARLGRGKKVELNAMCVWRPEEGMEESNRLNFAFGCCGTRICIGWKEKKKKPTTEGDCYIFTETFVHIKSCGCLLEMFLCVCHAYLHNFTQNHSLRATRSKARMAVRRGLGLLGSFHLWNIAYCCKAKELKRVRVKKDHHWRN